MFFVDTAFGQLVLIAIFFFIVGASLFALVEWWRFYNVEQKALDELKSRLSKSSTPINSKDDLYYFLSNGIPSSSAVSKRLKQFLALSKSNPSTFAFQNSKVLGESDSELNYLAFSLNYARPAIAFLGFLGALFGLVNLVEANKLAFFSGSSGISDVNFYSALHSIVTPMFWMILGITTVSFFLIPLSIVKKQFNSELESLSQLHLVPIFMPLTKDEELKNLVEVVSNNTNQMNGVAHKLEQISNELLIDFQHLNKSSSNLENTIISFSESQSSLQKDISILSQIVSGYKSQIEESQTGSLQVLEALNRHNQSADAIYKNMIKSEFDVGDWLKQIIALSQQQQTEFKETIKSVLNLTRSNLSSTQSMINRFSLSIKQFEKSMESMQNHIIHFNSAISSASDKEIHQLTDISAKLVALNQHFAQLRGRVNVPASSPNYNPGNSFKHSPAGLEPFGSGNTSPLPKESPYVPPNTIANSEFEPVETFNHSSLEELETKEDVFIADDVKKELQSQADKVEYLKKGLEEIELKKKKGGFSSLFKNILNRDEPSELEEEF